MIWADPVTLTVLFPVRAKSLVFIAVIALLAGWVLYDALWQPTRQQVDLVGIAKPNRAAPAVEQGSNSELQRRVEQLAERGRGQPLPHHLDMQIEEIQGNRHWIISDSDSYSEVKIPFLPGRLPQRPPELEPLAANPGFLGSQACAACHRERYESFIETAHHNTSRLATPATIDGSFDPQQNQLSTTNPNLHFRMIQRGDLCLQQVHFSQWQFEVPMQIVTGASRMGQTFLYWHKDALFQLNVTCLSSHDNAWVNSPGYQEGQACYERPILPRCLDCHATYADFREPPNHYTPDSLILGISCERCHGPGQSHVQHHTDHPQQQQPHEITVPSDLTRQQQLDLCGQCHSGLFPLRDQPFQFRPGDRLGQHYVLTDKGTPQDDGVHTSDQLIRLSQSECFRQSQMTCIDCHNPHRHEMGDSRAFSAKCMQCHQIDQCGMHDQLGDSLAENCYDCHMPKYQGKLLRFHGIGETVSLSLRDHHVRVDAESTRQFLQQRQEP